MRWVNKEREEKEECKYRCQKRRREGRVGVMFLPLPPVSTCLLHSMLAARTSQIEKEWGEIICRLNLLYISSVDVHASKIWFIIYKCQSVTSTLHLKRQRKYFQGLVALFSSSLCISTNVTQTLLPPSLLRLLLPLNTWAKSSPYFPSSSSYYFDFPLLSANPTFPNLRLFLLFVCSPSHERPRIWRRRKFDPNLPPSVDDPCST